MHSALDRERAAIEWLVWQLADSALPTGGFAHSWGLEAAFQSGEITGREGLRSFASDVVMQAGRSSLPLVTAAFNGPSRIGELDALSDVFLTNAVANRASRVQGRAFVATCARVWPSAAMNEVVRDAATLCGHVAPLYGVVLRLLDVPLATTQRLFLLNAVRGVLAAAVRLGITGSYDAQRLQFESRARVDDVVERCGALEAADLAQTAPIADLLQAAHDRLYSRLFQS